MNTGDIVLVRYPFTDLSSEKLRPALVLLGEDHEGDFLLAFITSSSLRKGDYDIPISKSGTGLHKDSVLRLKKIMAIHKSLISGRIGSVSTEQLASIKEKLRDMLEL